MKVKCDFLVIGSGIAGLSFALKAAKHGKVIILAKTKATECATQYAQGGIASVFSEKDSFENHIQDTLEAGAGLCNKKTVELTVREGPARVRELIDLGVSFSKNENTQESFPYDLTLEAGHTERRILHAQDFTGKAIIEAMLLAARRNPNIQFFENCIAIDLITNHSRVLAKTKELQDKIKTNSSTRKNLGVYALDTKNNQIHVFQSLYTVLATGGAGKVYLYTSNPDIASGDGIAMAYRAGARVANMEFMQFHPTCLYHPKTKSFLISEALRGEGGELVNEKGEAFAKNYHKLGSLAPRDIVARAIDSEIKKTGSECVYLDMRARSPDFLIKRFPNIYQKCLEFGLDITKQLIPVVPAAHYICGGVQTNEHGESTVENLFVIGESACTGLHGANRLASNSLLEGVVFAHRAYDYMTSKMESEKRLKTEMIPDNLPEWDHGMAVPMEEIINIAHTWKEIRMLMWNYVGIVRSNRRLEKAQARLMLITQEVKEYYWKFLLTSDLIELRNLVTTANLIVQSALLRKESRGLHYNTDYPHTDDSYFQKDTIL